jgi:hypothetical protein
MTSLLAKRSIESLGAKRGDGGEVRDVGEREWRIFFDVLILREKSINTKQISQNQAGMYLHDGAEWVVLCVRRVLLRHLETCPKCRI